MRQKTYNAILYLSLLVVSGLGTFSVWSSVNGSGLDFPFGPDPDIWGKAALLAKFNAPQTVPPFYPELTSFLAFSDGLVQGALRANVVGLGMGIFFSGLGAAWLTRKRYLSLGLGLSAALLVFYSLPFYPYLYFVQPDLLTFGLVSFCTASLIGVWRFQRWRYVFLCGFAMGLTFSTREHGLVLIVASVALLPFVLKASRWRHMLLLLLGIQLGGGLGAGAPHMPFFHPHGGWNGTLTKSFVAMRDTADQRTESNNTPSKWEVLAEKSDSRVDYFWYLAMQSKDKSKDFHSNLLLMGVGFGVLVVVYRRRFGVMFVISIAPLFATLLFWSQWRHFFVMAGPMVIFGLGAMGVALSRVSWKLSMLVVGGYVGYSCWILHPSQQSYARYTLNNYLKEQQKKQSYITLAKQIREQADSRSLVMAESIFSVLTGLNPIQLEGQELMNPKPPGHPNFIYWTYIVSTKRMTRQWELITQEGKFLLYQRKRPPGVSVPCLKGTWDGPIVEKLPPGGTRLKPNPLSGCP
ncbi:MAG: glycosyltransferase family 39 protein [Myxococcota bacterium]|nr:glycosyltransferase family 39 protein [Myxococcota bacterium]